MHLKHISIKLSLLCAAASLALASCDSPDEEFTAFLTEGYWAQEDAPDASLLNFSASGHLSYYVYTPSGDSGRYDACHDPAEQEYTEYATDRANGRICFLPDLWYDIKVLNRNSLTLVGDSGKVKFNKIDPANVRILSTEEYFSLHPAERTER